MRTKELIQGLILITVLLLIMLVSTSHLSPIQAVGGICDNVTQIPASECQTLETFYYSTSGGEWNNHSRWLVTTTPCSWYGVTCSSGHVTSLILENNQLRGTIPSQLSDLSELRILNLSINELRDPIPPEFSDLTHLQALGLANNQLNGTIPVELSTLSNLTNLSLDNNQLSGMIPPELGQLSNLTDLWLSDNQLNGGIPAELGQLSNLRILALSRNPLGGTIPAQLGNLSNLQSLGLGSNQLSGPIPVELGQLANLTGIYVEKNQLNGSLPSELGNLSNLSYLWVFDNQFSGNLPNSVGNLSNLEALRIEKNLLSGEVPQNLTNLSRLTTFYFNNTTLCEPDSPVFQDWLSSITDLQRTGSTCSNNPTDPSSIYLPIGIKSEPAPTAIATPTPTPTPPPIPITQTPIMVITPTPAAATPTQPPFEGDVIHVDSSRGSDSSNCGSEVAACSTLQQAVEVAKSNANSNILIKVAHGTYTGTGSNVVDIFLSPQDSNKNLTFIGGYDSSNWSVVSTNDPTATVIDGQNARRGIRIVSIYASQFHFENVTIQNGLAIEPVANIGVYSGGGLLCRNDNPNEALFISLTLNNMLFKNNRVNGRTDGDSAVSGGGASLYFRCGGNLNNVTFDGNVVQGANTVNGLRGDQALGGGLFLSGGFNIPTQQNQDTELIAQNVTFRNNRVIAGSGGTGFGFGLPDALGGGAAIQLSKASIDGVIAENNAATGGGASQQAGTASGAGLFFEINTGTVVVKNGTIKENTVTGGASPTGIGGIGSGGALMATDSTLQLENLTIVDNDSFGGTGNDGGDAGGGAMYFTTAGYAPSIVEGTNLIMADNVAQAGQGNNRYGGGGAIFSQDTTLTLNHATIARNSVLDTMQAPAIISQHNPSGSSRLTIRYSIISDHDGRDIFNNARAPIIAQTTGDTLTMNSVLSHNNTNDLESGTIYSSQPGLAQGTFNVSNVIAGDPAFVSQGSPSFNYHLTANSDAIDRASGSTTSSDIDGHIRPVGGAPDLGADEFSARR